MVTPCTGTGRVAPVCRHFGLCGGCMYQDLPYERQLELKENEALGLFREKHITIDAYRGIEGSQPFRYRNKMEYTFGDETKNGAMTLGMHKRKQFMSIITTDDCLIVAEDFNRIVARTLEFFDKKAYAHYNKKTHIGFQRNLILRRGERTGELMVNIVTTAQGTLDRAGYVEMLLSLKLDHTIVSILHTINDSPADFVYGQRLDVLFGRDYYMEEIAGLRFKVSAFSFFQTNVPAIEKLYREALDFIDDPAASTVFDLYSGTGTIAQILAQRAKAVFGIEIVGEAAAAAASNAAMNGLDNCHFITGDVLEVLKTIDEKPDVIVLDPPRAGVHPKALSRILEYGVRQIIYISCNPKTLANDLSVMQAFGYRAEKVKLYDNFPHTKHIEAAVGLRSSR